MRLKRINLLVESIKNSDSSYKEDDLDMLEKYLGLFSSYVGVVNQLENAYTIARFRMDAEYYRCYIESLDMHRRSTHDAAIVGMSWINRICGLYSSESVFTVEELSMDRYDKANIIMEIVKETYDRRRK